MICPDCGHDNIDGVDECEACGQSLVAFDPSASELEQAISRHGIEVLCPKSPVTIDASALAREAAAEMNRRDIGCLLVNEDGKLVGIFSERDVLNKVSADPSVLDRPVSELMTRDPETISLQDSIAYALQAMDVGGYRHLPIVDEDGRPVGIISIRDILRFLCVRFAELGAA